MGPSESGVVTRSTELSGLTLAISHGVPKLSPARLGSLMLSIMLVTMNWLEPRLLGRKKGAKLTDAEEAVINKKRSKKTQAKYTERQKESKVEQALLDQFMTGRVLASISSRPGQCGRSDGYVLEGKELEFYLRKIKAKRGR